MNEETYLHLRESLFTCRTYIEGTLANLDRAWHEQAHDEGRRRLDPIANAINAALEAADLPGVAEYDMDSGFDMIRVRLHGDSTFEEVGGLIIEDSFADYPRVGIYPPEPHDRHPEDAPIFDLRKQPWVEGRFALEDLDVESLRNTVVGLVRFAAGPLHRVGEAQRGHRPNPGGCDCGEALCSEDNGRCTCTCDWCASDDHDPLDYRHYGRDSQGKEPR